MSEVLKTSLSGRCGEKVMTSFFPSVGKYSRRKEIAYCLGGRRQPFPVAEMEAAGIYRYCFSPLCKRSVLNCMLSSSTDHKSFPLTLSVSRPPRFKSLLQGIIIFLMLVICRPGHTALTLAGRLNINLATKEELLLLPEVGQVEAVAIYSYRKKVGKIKDMQSLASVREISGKTLQLITPFIKLTGKSDLSIVDANSSAAPQFSAQHSTVAEIDLLSNEEYFGALLNAVKSAGKEIVISMFLFKVSDHPSGRINVLMDSLISAAGRGVDVSVILEEGRGGNNTVTMSNRKTSKRLMQGGVKVIFDEPGRTTHTKVVVIDKKSVFLGSHNFTSSALRHNNELSVNIRSTDFANDVLAYIESLK